jgi:hypothetical protein
MILYRPDGKTYKFKDNLDLVISVNEGETVYENDTWLIRQLRRLFCAVRLPAAVNSPHTCAGEGSGTHERA